MGCRAPWPGGRRRCRRTPPARRPRRGPPARRRSPANTAAPASRATVASQRLLAGPGRDDHRPGDAGARDRGAALGRPAAAGARRAGVDRRSRPGARRGLGGRREVELGRVGRDARLLQQPAPAGDLVLVRRASAARHRRRRRARARRGASRSSAVLCGPRPCRLTATSAPRRAGGAAASARTPSTSRTRVDRAASRSTSGASARRGQQHALVRREGARAARAAPARRSAGRRARARAGRRASRPGRLRLDGATTSSRTSQPAGWREREHHGLRRRRPGRSSSASGAGLVLLVAPVEEARAASRPGPAGSRRRGPPVSAASARVKPTTPNLLAQ